MTARSTLDDELGGAVIQRVVLSRDLLIKYGPAPATKFLDVGCGAGVIGRYLGEAVGAQEVHGIDTSRRLVELARQQGVAASVVNIDTTSLPFEDGTMHAVFCGEIIEHVLNPEHLLAEIRRILVPAGVCVLSTPNLASWVNRAALLLGWTPLYIDTTGRAIHGRPRWAFPEEKVPQGHIHVMTVPALKQVVRGEGFRIREAVPYGLVGNTPPDEFHTGSLLRRTVLGAVARVDKIVTRRETLAIGIILALMKSSDGDHPRPVESTGTP